MDTGLTPTASPSSADRLCVAAFLAQHPHARHGGLFQGRLLYNAYGAEAARTGHTVVNYLTFVRQLGPHIEEAIWHGGQVHYRLKPQATSTTHPMQVAASRPSPADTLTNRTATVCTWAMLALSGISWGVILHAVLP
jgi:hypothetical protein